MERKEPLDVLGRRFWDLSVNLFFTRIIRWNFAV